MKAWQRRTLFVLAGVIAIGVVGRWVAAPAPAAAGATVPGSPAGRAPAVPVAVPPGSEAAAASAPAALSPVDEVPALSAHARRMRDDWCGFGAAEAQREIDGLVAGGTERLIAAYTSSMPPDGVRLKALVRKQLNGQWAASLRRQGTPRAEAAAAYLATGFGADEAAAPESRARLQALARSSTDPMLTALALRRPCKPGDCRNIETSQWSRLEPDNLEAWLVLLMDPATRPEHSAYLFDQIAQRARFRKDYALEFAGLLASVESAETPGLEQQLGSELLVTAALEASVPSIRPLSQYCKGSAADAELAVRCEGLASVLWSGRTLIDRMMALALARQALSPQAPERPTWEARAREYEAASIMAARAADRLSQAAPESPAGLADCKFGPEFRHLARDVAQTSEWDRLQAEIAASGASVDELSRAWREANGRSALDPDVRPARAASQAR